MPMGIHQLSDDAITPHHLSNLIPGMPGSGDEGAAASSAGPTQDLAGYPCFYLQPWHPWVLLDERELQWMESDNVTW